MYNHYFDSDGVYQYSTPAYEGTIPAPDCIRASEPIDIPDGFWPVRNANGDGFDTVENHVGEQGWVNGESVKISRPGPLPEGWSDTPPTPPDTRTPEEKRRDAYNIEVDPHREKAISYQLEAEAHKNAGNAEAANIAWDKYKTSLANYISAKNEIRNLYPDKE